MKKRGTFAIKDAVAGAMKKHLKKHGFATYKLICDWEEIVGSQVAKISTPTTITKDGTLYLEASNAGFVVYMSAEQSLIIKRINTYIGYEAVKKIKIALKK